MNPNDDSRVSGLAEATASNELLRAQREANEQLVLSSLRAYEEADAAEASSNALRASEEQLRTLADTLPLLAWYANPDGYIPWYNRRWFDYTGTTLDDQEGWKWQSVQDPDDLPRIVAKWKAALASGEPWEDEFRLRRHDGQFRWFLSRAAPLRDSGGQIVRWFGTNVDIDDQRRAEAANLRHAEAERARLKTMFDEAPAAILVLRGQDLTIELANPIVLELFGRTSAIIGQLFIDAVPELHGQGFDDALRGVLKSGVAYHGEEVLMQVDRDRSGVLQGVHLDFVCVPLRAPDTGTDGLFVHAYDVTDMVIARRHTEALREDAERANRALARQNALATLAADVGRAFTLGGALRTVLDHCCSAFVRKLDVAFARVWTVDETGTTLELQASAGMYTHVDGSHARIRVGDLKIGWIAAAREPHLTNDVAADPRINDPEWARRTGMVSFAGYPLVIAGRLVGVLAMFARHPFRDDILASLAAIGNTIAIGIARAQEEAERKRLLASEQGFRKDAEAANRVKDEFLATMSHELRTPLNAILGWSSLLRRGTHDKKGVNRALATIERNAHAQARLIEDMLDVSRIISGKLRLDTRRVDMNAIARAAIDVVGPAADAKRVRLIVDLAPEEGVDRLVGDADRLQQVVWNLLSNAVKFTPPEGTVTLRVERIGSTARMIVRDTGPGIPREHLPLIFERFRQVDGSTTRRHGGLGLGLAIVRHLVELHGGTVGVESGGEGLGSTFTVSLPIRAIHEAEAEAEAQHQAEVQAQAATSSAPLPPALLSGVKILVVDDDEDSRLLVASALEYVGALVKTVASAHAAIAFIENHPVDVLISDIGMPDEDGFSLMQRLRAMPASRGGQVPALALTAYARDEDVVRAHQVGFHCHIAKPADLDELTRSVAELVSRTARPIA